MFNTDMSIPPAHLDDSVFVMVLHILSSRYVFGWCMPSTLDTVFPGCLVIQVWSTVLAIDLKQTYTVDIRRELPEHHTTGGFIV